MLGEGGFGKVFVAWTADLESFHAAECFTQHDIANHRLEHGASRCFCSSCRLGFDIPSPMLTTAPGGCRSRDLDAQ